MVKDALREKHGPGDSLVGSLASPKMNALLLVKLTQMREIK